MFGDKDDRKKREAKEVNVSDRKLADGVDKNTMEQNLLKGVKKETDSSYNFKLKKSTDAEKL